MEGEGAEERRARAAEPTSKARVVVRFNLHKAKTTVEVLGSSVQSPSIVLARVLPTLVPRSRV